MMLLHLGVAFYATTLVFLLLFGIPHMPASNLLGVLTLIGVGCDDVFVLFDGIAQ